MQTVVDILKTHYSIKRGSNQPEGLFIDTGFDLIQMLTVEVHLITFIQKSNRTTSDYPSTVN